MDIQSVSSQVSHGYEYTHIPEQRMHHQELQNHAMEFGLDDKESGLYTDLLNGLNQGQLSPEQSQTLATLMKKMYKIDNIYFQGQG